MHLIDAACAALASGEPRRAKSILARIEPDVDPLIARKREVCEAWIVSLDENWFPGDICSSDRETVIQVITRDGRWMDHPANDYATFSDDSFSRRPGTVISRAGLFAERPG